MAESLATQASRGHRTLCLPFEEESYRRVVGEWATRPSSVVPSTPASRTTPNCSPSDSTAAMS
jgi:hypothetical protein